MSDFKRFLKAQEATHKKAINELANGYKISHWMWWTFPQDISFGVSNRSIYYGLKGKVDAYNYLQNIVLKTRLEECCLTLLALHPTHNVKSIFGALDEKKLKNSLELFASVSLDDDGELDSHSIFQRVLDRYYFSESNTDD